MELLWQALRQVVFLLDQVAYGLIPSAYELIFYLANVNLFNNEILSALINRVYLLLGIFMLFKIAFSLIQYMIDPNTFNDKSKGFGKLITNTLVAVVLLVMTPFIFQEAYKLQGDIILSNVIPRLILGDTSYDDYSGKTASKKALKEKQAEIHSMGVDVQFTMFSAFFTLNTDDNTNGYKACRPTQKKPLRNVIGSSDMLNDSKCWDAVKTDLTNELHKQGGTLKGLFKYDASAKTPDTDDAKCTNKICDERDFSNFGKLLWWIKAGGNSPFTITYIPIISAIVGAYLLLLLVTFSIDIAVRVFKLLFLQMVAPIAIISYMDPKESVGSGKFHNWAAECGKTYLSLFLRLAVIYAAIQLVRVILSSAYGVMADGSSIYYNGMAPTDTLNVFVYIFLILGIFTFAKKVPQMIEGIFGIKLSGEMNLNPFKTIKDNNILSTAIGAGLGGAAGLTAGLRAGASAGAPLRGGLSGLVSGIAGGSHSKLQNGMFGDTRNKVYKQLTGNEMSVYNPWQKVMSVGGQKKIDQVGKPLSNARGQMNDAQTRLNAASRSSADSLSFLRTRGITQENMSDVRTSNIASRDRAAQNRDAAQARISTLMQERKKHNDFIANASAENERFNAQYDRLKGKLQTETDPVKRQQYQNYMKKFEESFDNRTAQIDQAKNAISGIDNQLQIQQRNVAAAQEEYDSYNDIISAIDNYNDSVSEENKIRKEIAGIQADIDTLSSEKSQRKRFYGIDDSPKQKVDDALQHVQNRNGNNQ